MRRRIFFLQTVIFCGVSAMLASGQISPKIGSLPNACPVPSALELKRVGKLSEKDELRYRTPIRYVIVYNEIGPTGGREIEVFMKAANINERDLRAVFCWISQSFPSPVALTINVHTDLNTIETPEERELLKDGEDSRFSKFYGRYREASYSRFDNRREAFLYTKNLAEIKQTLVVIREGQTD